MSRGKSIHILRHLLAPLFLLLLAGLIVAGTARADEQSWDSLLDEQNGKLVAFGARIAGPEPFARADHEAFVPASITKLFTAALALDRLGPDYRFETRLRWRTLAPAGSGRVQGLTIIGDGDPSWSVAQLEKMAALLASAGVREIRGPIRWVSTDARWDNSTPPLGWETADLVTCDGALPHAFNLALNCATLMIRDLQHAHWQEAGLAIPVQLALAEGPRTSTEVERIGAGYRVSGTLAKGSLPLRLALPVEDPAAWVQALLTRALITFGIQVLPESPASPVIASEGTASLPSLPLKELLKPFLKDSINVVGQALYLAAGGAPALQAYLHAHLPSEDALAVTLQDGNGMSRASRVTPAAVLALLEELSQAPDFAALWDALPIAGVDGTLAFRMRGTAAEGLVRAKTGTLHGVYNLAGYAPSFDASGRPISFTPFVVLGQTDSRWIAAAHAAQDRVAARLAVLVNR